MGKLLMDVRALVGRHGPGPCRRRRRRRRARLIVARRLQTTGTRDVRGRGARATCPCRNAIK